MNNDSCIRWSQWNNGGVAAFGQMPKRDMQKKLQDFEVEARKLLKQTGADHVVYGVKHFSEEGGLEGIRFYLKLMDEDEFERNVANVPGWQVYAVHRMI